MKQVKLSTGDLEMLRRVREGKFADSTIDPYAPFDYEVESKDFIHPLSGVPDPKRRFVPSKNERLRVSKYVQALKKGWMKTLAEKEQEEKEEEETRHSNLLRTLLQRCMNSERNQNT